MAHPETEAQTETDFSNEEPLSVALTVEEAALKLENIFENDPAEQTIKKRQYNQQKALSDDLKKIKLDQNDDLSPHMDGEADQDQPQEFDEEEDEKEDEDDQIEPDDEDSGTDDPSVIQAPVSWSKEQQKIFETLPPEAQSVIVERERDRDKGFQTKTTELAEQRRNLHALEQDVIRERQQYADGLAQNLTGHMKEPDIEMLNQHSPNYNPAQYNADKQNYDQLTVQQQMLQHQVDRYEELIKHNDKASQLEYIKLHDVTLRQKIPDWDNDTSRDQIIQFGIDHGYSREDVQTATPEEVSLLNKAMKYDTLMRNKPSIRDQVKTAPKVQKPGSKRRGQSTKHSLAQAKNKLAKSGTTEDAAAVLAHIMKD